jgi:hypothetical protein
VLNPELRPKTIADLNAQAEKLLRGLGIAEPPLDLRLVRDLLHLDRQYYSSTNDGAIAETVSRLKVAGQQIMSRPGLLKTAILKFSLKALYLPDQRRILLDQEVPKLKHRWNEAHEIGHSIIPWHGGMMLVDNKQTLLPMCHEQMEAEANYVAGRLLFAGTRFKEQATSSPAALEWVRSLAKSYGNTATSTLWRFVEEAHPGLPMFALVSGHPHVLRRDKDFDSLNPCRYYIQSPAFRARFGQKSATELFQVVSSYCGAQQGGYIGKADVGIVDGNNLLHNFRCETFFNRYEALSLGVWRETATTSYAFGQLA